MQYLESIFKEGDIVIFEKQTGNKEQPIKEVEGRVVSILTGEIPEGQPKSIYQYPVLVKLGSLRGHRTFTHDGRLVADGVINLRLKEQRITLHKPFAIGDEVIRSTDIFGNEHTKGRVTDITNCVSSIYIVQVLFEDSKHFFYYSLDGSYCKGQKQTLYHVKDFNILTGNTVDKPTEGENIFKIPSHISEAPLQGWEKMFEQYKELSKNEFPIITNFGNKVDYTKKEEYPIPDLIGTLTSKNNSFELSEDKEVLTVREDKEAFKDDAGKLFYEIDFEFIKHIAERMASNKVNGKYEPFNWKKPMSEKSIEGILHATFRHMLELMQGNYEDDGRPFGHLEAVASNIMIINHHVRKPNPKPFDFRLLMK